MKKLILSLMLLAGIGLNSYAAQTSVIVPANTMTNFILLSGNPTKVLSVSAATFSTNSANIFIYDTPTNQFLYTNAAYTNILSYATNWINTWTNYYGRTNSVTNIALIDVTNTVTGTTNSYNLEFAASIGTNATVTANNVNAVFTYGVWVTNQSVGASTVTITYQQ